MIRWLIPLALALAGCHRDGPTPRPPAAPCPGGPDPAVTEALREISDAAHRALLPSLSEIPLGELPDRGSAAVQPLMERYEGLLRAEAGRRLAALPRLDPARLPPYAKMTESLEKGVGWDLTKLGLGSLGMMRWATWDAIQVGAMIRAMVLARLGTEELARRTMLGHFGTPVSAVDASADAPVLAFHAGPEVFVVTLRYTALTHGYVPVTVDWRTEVRPSETPPKP